MVWHHIISNSLTAHLKQVYWLITLYKFQVIFYRYQKRVKPLLSALVLVLLICLGFWKRASYFWFMFCWRIPFQTKNQKKTSFFTSLTDAPQEWARVHIVDCCFDTRRRFWSSHQFSYKKPTQEATQSCQERSQILLLQKCCRFK